MEKETQVKAVKKDNSLGSIRIADEVVSIIAGLAATEVEGIAGMSGGLVGGIAEMLGRKNFAKGVKVEVGEHAAAEHHSGHDCRYPRRNATADDPQRRMEHPDIGACQAEATHKPHDDDARKRRHRGARLLVRLPHSLGVRADIALGHCPPLPVRFALQENATTPTALLRFETPSRSANARTRKAAGRTNANRNHRTGSRKKVWGALGQFGRTAQAHRLPQIPAR